MQLRFVYRHATEIGQNDHRCHGDNRAADRPSQRVDQILQAEDHGADFNDTATVTDSLHDEVITRLRSQYLDIAAREADWSARYGADHLATVNLRNQMAQIP